METLRDRHPELPIGVTTGIWAARDHKERMNQVRGWRHLPDYASVNWHEEGADELADLLLDRGIGIEAGLWHVAAAEQFRRYPRANECLRVLIEGTNQDVDEAIAEARQVLQIVTPLSCRYCYTAKAPMHGRCSTLRSPTAWTPGSVSRTRLCYPTRVQHPTMPSSSGPLMARTTNTQGEQ